MLCGSCRSVDHTGVEPVSLRSKRSILSVIRMVHTKSRLWSDPFRDRRLYAIITVWLYSSRSSEPGMSPVIPFCSLVFIIVYAFSYGKLAGRGCEKAHEAKPTSCGFLNGVHSVRHHASHLLFLTSIPNDFWSCPPAIGDGIKKCLYLH